MIKPKEKKERALGEHLHLKGNRCLSPKCAVVRKPYRPGAHGKTKKPGRMGSDFGRQMIEKQKVKVTYGLTEKGLEQIFNRAKKSTGSTSAKLLELIERRLDNVVFRLGFALSRRMARQFVVHGHIFVNGRRVTSPGFSLRSNDVVSFRAESKNIKSLEPIKEALKNRELPSWLSLDVNKLEGKILGNPENLEAPFEINLLVESFSK